MKKNIYIVFIVILLIIIVLGMIKINNKNYDIYIFNPLTNSIIGLKPGYENIKNLTIPSKINNISVKKVDFGDLKLEKLEKVCFEKGIEEISKNSFSNCNNLVSIVFPDTILKIADNSFSGCNDLKNLTIAKNIEYIGENAFSNCEKLENVYIPDKINYIGKQAFSNTKFLINIETGKTRISENLYSKFINIDNYNSNGYAGEIKGGKKEEKRTYIQVFNVNDLQNALKIKNDVIIEIMNDLDLGWNYIKNEINNNGEIQKHSVPKTHPVLIESGVSKVILENKTNISLFSKNNSKILHATLKFLNCNNVNIFNLEFDELWEWDEDSKGEYKTNNWDFIDLKGCSNIWIHDCIFGQSYDGIIDINNTNNITISYCKVIPNNNKTFYKKQFDYLEENKEKYDLYYELRTKYDCKKEELEYIYDNQYKAFNFGGMDNNDDNKNINITMHHNYFKNIKSRIPRLRSGILHFYNNLVECTELKNNMNTFANNHQKEINNELKNIILNSIRGVIITEEGKALIENSIFIDIDEPFRNYSNELNKEKDLGKIIVKNSYLKNEEIVRKYEDEDINLINNIPYKYELDNVENIEKMLKD